MQSYLNTAQTKKFIIRIANRKEKESHEKQLRKNERLKAEGLQPETWLAKEGSKPHEYERVSGEVISYLEQAHQKAIIDLIDRQRGKKKTIMVP